jgi:hypothetical protein
MVEKPPTGGQKARPQRDFIKTITLIFPGGFRLVALNSELLPSRPNHNNPYWLNCKK